MAKLKAGQVAVVTGAATGIGFALADALLRKGLHVAVTDRDAQALDRAAARLRSGGGEVLPIQVDVTDAESLIALRASVEKTYGGVDVLCNNAGLYNVLQPIWCVDVAGWRKLFEVNFWGVVNGIQAFMPGFIERGRGHVLNTASMGGLTIVPGSGAYGASKHAVVAMSETLRADLDAAGHSAIGVTVLCPGLVRTAMGEQAISQYGEARDGTNLARILEPAQVAEAALAGIERDQLFVAPSPGSRDRFVQRVERVLAAWDAA